MNVVGVWVVRQLQPQVQWRIQDFPEEGAPTPQGGANIQFCQNLPKTGWNWKNLDPQGGASLAPALDPPLKCQQVPEIHEVKNGEKYKIIFS